MQGAARMKEASLIARTSGLPATVESMTQELRDLGVAAGSAMIVHSSLLAMGWVVGGPPAVIEALTRTLGPQGTLMMPTHSRHLTDPAQWRSPPVPRNWIDTIVQHMPAYDPATTPTRIMGSIPESFRSHPGTRRSRHPHVSFAARGPQAARLTDGHSFDNAMGEASPLARLYDLDGQVLLLGVGHAVNTSLHLAEHRCSWPGKHRVSNIAPILIDGVRRVIELSDISFDDSDFPQIGTAFERETSQVRLGPVGQAVARLMPMRSLVDFGARWIAQNRAWAERS